MVTVNVKGYLDKPSLPARDTTHLHTHPYTLNTQDLKQKQNQTYRKMTSVETMILVDTILNAKEKKRTYDNVTEAVDSCEPPRKKSQRTQPIEPPAEQELEGPIRGITITGSITPKEFFEGKELRLAICFNDVDVIFKISARGNEKGDVFKLRLTGPMEGAVCLDLEAEALTPTEVFDAATTLAQTAIPELLKKCSVKKF